MYQQQDVRILFLRLQLRIDAERLGNHSHAAAIAEIVTELRSAIQYDEESSLCELVGPLGSLERLAQERRDCMGDEEAYLRWRVRWSSVLEQAGAFVDSVLNVSHWV